MDLKHQDPNVYTIKPLNGKGLLSMVNWHQLSDHQKSQENINPSDQAADTILPISLTKKISVKDS